METTISVEELAERLTDLLDRVQARGKRVVIERDGKAVAVLSPPQPKRGITGAELMASIGHLRMPGEGFADDLEAVQAAQRPAAPPGVTMREIIDRVGDLKMPGDGFADDLEAIHAAQGEVKIPEWPD